MQYAIQGYSQTQFFYGLQPGVLYDPGLGFLDRDQAIATRPATAARAFGIYPLNRYARLEMFGGITNFEEKYDDPALQEVYADQYQIATYGRTLFRNGTVMPFGAALVQETTVFREFGPLAGNTVRLGYEYRAELGQPAVAADRRRRRALLPAAGGQRRARLPGPRLQELGGVPRLLYFGGNSEMRGYDYLQFLGNKAAFFNAELRFPLIEALLTPIGVIGGIRGIAFANFGAAGYEGVPMKASTSEPLTVTPLIGFQPNFTTLTYDPVYGPPRTIDGFRLLDSRASYGVGLETFALGFPIHFDWAWRTLMNRDWEDYVYSYQGISEGTTGSKWFRKARFSMWIGYDF